MLAKFEVGAIHAHPLISTGIHQSGSRGIPEHPRLIPNPFNRNRLLLKLCGEPRAHRISATQSPRRPKSLLVSFDGPPVTT